MQDERFNKNLDFAAQFKKFWNAENIPFIAADSKPNFFLGTERQFIFETLLASATIPGTLTALSGVAGTGKSFFAKRMHEQLHYSKVQPILLTFAEEVAEPNWLLKKLDHICDLQFQLGFFSYLEQSTQNGRGVCLLFDGAHRMLRSEAWEDCIALIDLQSNLQTLISWVLIFDVQKAPILQLPASLMMRLTHQYLLPPFTAEESLQYITSELALAGIEREVFTNEARSEIVNRSEGKPAFINVFCFEKMQNAMWEVSLRPLDDKVLPNRPKKSVRKKVVDNHDSKKRKKTKLSLDDFLKVNDQGEFKKSG